MTSELFNVFGSSKAASTSGTCSGAVYASGYLNLASEIWTGGASGLYTWVSGVDGSAVNSAPQSIRIPKGTALKIWESKISVNDGIPGRINIELSNDSGTTYRTVASDALTEMSGYNSQQSTRRSGRPLVFPSADGKTMVRFYYTTEAATGGIFGEYNCEIVELNYD